MNYLSHHQNCIKWYLDASGNVPLLLGADGNLLYGADGNPDTDEFEDAQI
jgi:hypothetical protein